MVEITVAFYILSWGFWNHKIYLLVLLIFHLILLNEKLIFQKLIFIKLILNEKFILLVFLIIIYYQKIINIPLLHPSFILKKIKTFFQKNRYQMMAIYNILMKDC